MKKHLPSYKLYWVSTPDHNEDWFVIARTKREAERFFEGYEGYNPNTASAKLICSVPSNKQSKVHLNYAQATELRWCGGRPLPRATDELEKERAMMGSGGRIYQFGTEVYSEGDIIRNVATALRGKAVKN